MIKKEVALSASSSSYFMAAEGGREGGRESLSSDGQRRRGKHVSSQIFAHKKRKGHVKESAKRQRKKRKNAHVCKHPSDFLNFLSSSSFLQSLLVPPPGRRGYYPTRHNCFLSCTCSILYNILEYFYRIKCESVIMQLCNMYKQIYRGAA